MDASVVLTGGPDDRAIVDEAESRLAAAGVRRCGSTTRPTS
jgi:hypothetical protein